MNPQGQRAGRFHGAEECYFSTGTTGTSVLLALFHYSSKWTPVTYRSVSNC